MNTFELILGLIVCIPFLLLFTFAITGFITSELGKGEKKQTPSWLFIVIFIIVLCALIFGGNVMNDTHIFKP